MDCPVCKYPNPQGASHCGMCYEVFNRSAAENYLRLARRDNARRQQLESDAPGEAAIVRTAQVAQSIPWRTALAPIVALLGRHRRWVAYAAAGVGLIVLALLIHPFDLVHGLFGRSFVYRFPYKTPTGYLVGFRSDIKSWSEKNARLDTPIETKRIEEIGTLQVQPSADGKRAKSLTLSVKEWIQIVTTNEKTDSRTLPPNNPSLMPLTYALDKRGSIVKAAAPSPRIGASASFVLPQFPSRSIRKGQTWQEPVQWVEVDGEFKMAWRGKLVWRYEGPINCGDVTCDKLSYRADITPQLWAGPSWLGNAFHRARYNGTARGEAIYDPKAGLLLSNVLEHNGLFRFSVEDVGIVPDERRIGRFVHGRGEILLQLDEKIDIRKQ